ncbi:putative sulfate transporter 3.3 [Platanthera zijinensis]|uniref:Sulfate transporter 3.3 n=1 Tax=Platanthera zijinensis TaxID=2320716 RepID=A0AAP0ATJ7_9ASPA
MICFSLPPPGFSSHGRIIEQSSGNPPRWPARTAGPLSSQHSNGNGSELEDSQGFFAGEKTEQSGFRVCAGINYTFLPFPLGQIRGVPQQQVAACPPMPFPNTGLGSSIQSPVSQGISCAKLANLPPTMGLYTNLVPPLIYAVLGNSRELSVGPASISSLVLGSMLSEVVSPEIQPTLYLQLALTATFFAGLFQASLGLLR